MALISSGVRSEAIVRNFASLAQPDVGERQDALILPSEVQLKDYDMPVLSRPIYRGVADQSRVATVFRAFEDSMKIVEGELRESQETLSLRFPLIGESASTVAAVAGRMLGMGAEQCDHARKQAMDYNAQAQGRALFDNEIEVKEAQMRREAIRYYNDHALQMRNSDQRFILEQQRTHGGVEQEKIRAALDAYKASLQTSVEREQLKVQTAAAAALAHRYTEAEQRVVRVFEKREEREEELHEAEVAGMGSAQQRAIANLRDVRKGFQSNEELPGKLHGVAFALKRLKFKGHKSLEGISLFRALTERPDKLGDQVFWKIKQLLNRAIKNVLEILPGKGIDISLSTVSEGLLEDHGFSQIVFFGEENISKQQQRLVVECLIRSYTKYGRYL